MNTHPHGHICSTTYLDSLGIAIGQTWQDEQLTRIKDPQSDVWDDAALVEPVDFDTGLLPLEECQSTCCAVVEGLADRAVHQDGVADVCQVVLHQDTALQHSPNNELGQGRAGQGRAGIATPQYRHVYLPRASSGSLTPHVRHCFFSACCMACSRTIPVHSASQQLDMAHS